MEQRVVDAKKKIPLAADDLFRAISGNGKIDQKLTVKGVRASIRLIITMRNADFYCWSMALLVNNLRVAGVDWEGRVHDHRGHRCSGWHKHVWTPKIGSADRKECLDQFNPSSGWDFVKLGLRVMGFEPLGDSKKGDGNGNRELFAN